MNESIALGKAVREIRQSQQKSIGQLANEIGCSPVMISRLESGIATISARMIKRIAESLEVDVDLLYSGSEDSIKTPASTAKDIAACIELLNALSERGQIAKAHSLLAAALSDANIGHANENRKFA